jgi:hypothetical protein
MVVNDDDEVLRQPQGVERAEGDRPIDDGWLWREKFTGEGDRWARRLQNQRDGGGFWHQCGQQAEGERWGLCAGSGWGSVTEPPQK